MNNVFVYIETEGTQVAEVSQELLTKGRKLADQLGVELHAVVAGWHRHQGQGGRPNPALRRG